MILMIRSTSSGKKKEGKKTSRSNYPYELEFINIKMTPRLSHCPALHKKEKHDQTKKNLGTCNVAFKEMKIIYS
jgi:hypothetical protein